MALQVLKLSCYEDPSKHECNVFTAKSSIPVGVTEESIRHLTRLRSLYIGYLRSEYCAFRITDLTPHITKLTCLSSLHIDGKSAVHNRHFDFVESLSRCSHCLYYAFLSFLIFLCLFKMPSSLINRFSFCTVGLRA